MHTTCSKFAENILNIVLPQKCVACQTPGTIFCTTCQQKLYQQTAPTACPVCGKPAIEGLTHPRCRSNTNQYLDQVVCGFPYTEPAKSLVVKLKYKKLHSLANTMMQLLITDLEERGIVPNKNWVVIPVPLHPFRKMERGFNQSELLAKPLAKHFGLEYYHNVLERIRNTTPQIKLKRGKRLENVRGAFEVRQNKQHFLNEKSVILVDDVFTTGATLRECAKALKKSKVSWVCAITFAKR